MYFYKLLIGYIVVFSALLLGEKQGSAYPLECPARVKDLSTLKISACGNSSPRPRDSQRCATLDKLLTDFVNWSDDSKKPVCDKILSFKTAKEFFESDWLKNMDFYRQLVSGRPNGDKQKKTNSGGIESFFCDKDPSKNCGDCCQKLGQHASQLWPAPAGQSQLDISPRTSGNGAFILASACSGDSPNRSLGWGKQQCQILKSHLLSGEFSQARDLLEQISYEFFGERPPVQGPAEVPRIQTKPSVFDSTYLKQKVEELVCEPRFENNEDLEIELKMAQIQHTPEILKKEFDQSLLSEASPAAGDEEESKTPDKPSNFSESQPSDQTEVAVGTKRKVPKTPESTPRESLLKETPKQRLFREYGPSFDLSKLVDQIKNQRAKVNSEKVQKEIKGHQRELDRLMDVWREVKRTPSKYQTKDPEVKSKLPKEFQLKSDEKEQLLNLARQLREMRNNPSAAVSAKNYQTKEDIKEQLSLWINTSAENRPKLSEFKVYGLLSDLAPELQIEEPLVGLMAMRSDLMRKIESCSRIQNTIGSSCKEVFKTKPENDGDDEQRTSAKPIVDLNQFRDHLEKDFLWLYPTVDMTGLIKENNLKSLSFDGANSPEILSPKSRTSPEKSWSDDYLNNVGRLQRQIETMAAGSSNSVSSGNSMDPLDKFLGGKIDSDSWCEKEKDELSGFVKLNVIPKIHSEFYAVQRQLKSEIEESKNSLGQCQASGEWKAIIEKDPEVKLDVTKESLKNFCDKYPYFKVVEGTPSETEQGGH